MTKTGTASRTTAETGSADLKSNAMVHGKKGQIDAMVSVANLTIIVKTQVATEASALT